MEKIRADIEAARLPFVDSKTLTDGEQALFASLQEAIAIIEKLWDMFSRTSRYKTCVAIGDVKLLLRSYLCYFHDIEPERRQSMHCVMRMKFNSKIHAKNVALIFRKAPSVWSDADRLETKERFTRLMAIVAPAASTLRK
jgi:hypothetical protein